MANETVVVELTIDARGAEAGSAAYVRAHKAAQAAADRTIDQANAATVAMEKQTTVMTASAGSIASTARAWDRFKASVDPVFASTQRMESALLTADAAARKLGVDQAEINRVMDLARAKHLGAASAIGTVGTAARLTSNQMLNLSRQGNDVITMFALGANPMQIFASQAGQIYDALETGPRGLRGSLEGIGTAARSAGKALLGFLATPEGIAVGLVAAAAGVAAYVAATREDIKSVDEILKGHKQLIDEIAGAYPEAAAAAKRYEEQANQLPQTVLAANAKNKLEDAKKTLASNMDDARRQMALLNTGDGDFARIGKAGVDAFTDLAREIKAGTLDAAGLQSELGRLQIDPALSKNAHDFAEGLQATANAAAKAASVVNSESGIKAITDSAKDAGATLFDVSKGLKSVGTSASGSTPALSRLMSELSSGSMSGIDTNVRSLQTMANTAAAAGQEQLKTLVTYNGELRKTKAELVAAQQAIASAAGANSIGDFFGNISSIKGAQAALGSATNTIDRLFSSMRRGGASAQLVADGIEMVRNALIQGGLPVDKVNAFVDAFVAAQMQVDGTTASVKLLERAIQQLHDKTINITTVYSVVGGGSVGVQRGYTGPGGHAQRPVAKIGGMDPNPFGSASGDAGGPSGEISTTGLNAGKPIYYIPSGMSEKDLPQTNTYDYQARAAGGPVSAGGTYLVGEKGPEIVTMAGAGNVSTASATAGVLSGGADRLKSIEENTFQTVEEIKRSVGYLETLEKDGLTSLSVLRAIQSAIGRSSGSSGGGSSSGYSGGGSSGGSGSTHFSSSDPNSPYYFRNNAGRGPSGPNFDPLADYLLNGNKSMLGAIGQGLAGSPSNIDMGYDMIGGGGSRTWRQDFLAQLARTGPQTGSYGGGINISADSDFISGANTFSGGFTGPGANTRLRPGFATGGAIHPGDTQKVEAWKRPDEAVAFFRPEQRAAVGDAMKGSGGKTVHMGGIHIHMPAGSQQTSKQSQMEIADRLRRVVRDELGNL
ncbi:MULTISPECIES: phage tail length tape measure family protein [unclassified Mesorhizobium]|uniref:phage tail length tape measure family protein n=1 Tax=unclassified Mesorhizobium TaxID=325217 RepID=UPI0003CE7E7F|nr:MULTISPECIES: phage tail length tape measure family protein [unclassified Mesorhizobium]ESY58295.1 hypothetical protein X745_04150 [Mesorhizobium sp. LNJC374B00]ESY59429.1 hypothetical protein X744_12790 [Mesorhizobium sp. LNJC372A00]WJI79498.1 phage tail length tape measure family protein [Mesorhizobium sp. C374B]WJI86033.1 phage tail length tape measure family protein [Mesorhizobium sp. C372A]